MNSEFQATTSSIWAEYSLLIMPAEIFTEMDLKSMTTNSFNFQIITLKFIGIFGGWGGGGWGVRGHLATMDNTIIKANNSG